jgi:hypothetical protein
MQLFSKSGNLQLSYFFTFRFTTNVCFKPLKESKSAFIEPTARLALIRQAFFFFKNAT